MYFLAAPFILLFLAEAAVIGVNRNQPRRWPILAVVTYLGTIALALALAFAGRGSDEFGYGWLPAILLADPFYFVAPQFMMRNLLLMMVLGTAFMSAVLYALAFVLGYSRNSKKIAARPVPAEESNPKP